jgi:hypothetical protein
VEADKQHRRRVPMRERLWLLFKVLREGQGAVNLQAHAARFVQAGFRRHLERKVIAISMHILQ